MQAGYMASYYDDVALACSRGHSLIKYDNINTDSAPYRLFLLIAGSIRSSSAGTHEVW